MERIENTNSKSFGLKKLGTSLALIGTLLTQSPQEAYTQDIITQPKIEEILNDSTIEGAFTPDLIEKIGTWDGGSFSLNPQIIKKDENGNRYISINGNKYYDIYNTFFDKYSGLGYLRLGLYCSTPKAFFVGAVKDSRIGSNGILIEPNGNKYQGCFEDEIFEGNGTMDFGDGRHYEGNFHEGKINGKGDLTWKNGDYYKGNFSQGKRDGEGTMVRKSGGQYKGTRKNDSPIKDPRHSKDPAFIGKGTYIYSNNDQTTYEISNGNRPSFISVQDKKNNENWDNKRGTLVYIVKDVEGKKSYELHSRNRDISYKEEENHFIFSAQDGAELKFNSNIGERKAKAIANLINSVMFMVKHNDKGYSFYAFDYMGNTLQAQYRNSFFDTNLVKDIPGKIGISAEEFSEWLNHYRKDKSDYPLDY